MGLHLVTGSANSGKTGRVYEFIRQRLRDGRSPVLVVPATTDVARANAELSAGFPMGVRVSTFDGLVKELWSENGDGRSIASPAQRAFLLAAASRECDAPRSLGIFAARCVDLLSEQTGEKWRDGRPSLKGPGALLAHLMDYYAQSLGRLGLIEPAEAAWALTAGLLPRALAVHRFADFTPSQLVLLERARTFGEVVVTLNEIALPGSDSSAVVEALAPDSVERVLTPPYWTSQELVELGQSLSAEPFRIESTDKVRFLLSQGLEAEAHSIVAQAASALASGVAGEPHEVAIAFRDPRSHIRVLQRALSEAGLPADFDVSAPFSSSGFGLALLDALRFALLGRREPLLNFLRSAFSGATSSEVREIERKWRSNGVTDRRRMLREANRVLPPTTASVLEELCGIEGTLGTSSIKVVSAAARRLFATVYGAAVEGEAPAAESDARAHARVQDVLSDAAALGEHEVDLSGLVMILEGATITPRAVERPGHVQVMSMERLRGRRFEVVILGGLNAGEMPAPVDESMLPGSEVARVLAAFGGSGDATRGAEFDELLFQEAVSRARQRLVLSARCTDSDGDAVPLSPFFERAADCYREGDAELPPHIHRALGERPRLDGGSERERLRASALEGDGALPRVLAGQKRLRTRPGVLVDAAALGRDQVLSVSQIETYLRCPYLWFYERVLRPQELESGFEAREEGNLAHELLHRVHVRLAEDNQLPLNPNRAETATQLLRDVWADLVQHMGPPKDLSEEMGRQRALRWALRVIRDDADADSAFVPKYFEWSFGFDDDPVELGGVRIRGRIDRIDVSPDQRACVIDYKRTLKRAFNASNMIAEGSVQAAVYMAVVRSRLALDPVAALYCGLSKPGARGVVLDGVEMGHKITRTDRRTQTELDALLEEALGLVQTAASGMRAGDIGPRPRVDGACTFCPAAQRCEVCR